MIKRACVIDIESNGFTESLLDFSSFPYKFTPQAKLWCVVIRDIDTGEEWWAELDQVTEEWMEEKLKPFYFIVAHNGIKFDFPQLMLFGVLKYTIGYIGKPDTCFGKEVKFLDSLILSRLGNPDRGGHSLDMWGRRVGEHKSNYRQDCIDAGYIDKDDPSGAEFASYNPLMLDYCITPDHKLLKDDLTWIEADYIEVGDRVLGFDEYSDKNRKGRRYKTSTIEKKSYEVRPVFEVKLSSGKVFKVTEEHKWLTVNRNTGGPKYKWVETKDLKEKNKHKFGSKIPKLFDVWEEDSSKDAGWLAGMFDGEGTLVKNRFDIRIAQRPTLILDKLEKILSDKYSGEISKRYTKKPSDCISLILKGKAADRLKFLGEIRPERLIKKFNFEKLGRLESKNNVEEVLSIKYIGDINIVKIQTDTSTFICDGYPMHNCKQDCKTNAKVFKAIMDEFRNHDWGDSIQMEHKLADLAIRREMLGFKFDKELALECLDDLNNTLQDLANKVEPIIPAKPLNQTELNYWTPPKTQVKKNGDLSRHMINFLARIDAKCKDDGFVFQDEFYKIPHTEGALKESVPAQMKDFDHIKMYLISLGWDPIEWGERDLTKDSKKKNLSFEKRVETLDRWWKKTFEKGVYTKHRLEGIKENLRIEGTEEEVYESIKERLKDKWPVRVYTSPKVKVGIEKELCPNLEKLGEKVAFAKDFADWLTYRHRRNAIAGGLDEETGSLSSGFLKHYRDVDGRIGTPAIEIGASTGRYTHKVVANIPRAASVYGKQMRSLFRAGENAVFFGFDYSSLENRIQGSYIYRYKGGPEMAEALVAEKPNDIHSQNSRKLGIPRSEVKSFTYACLSFDTEVLTTTGFIPITEIMPDDKVISYNVEKDLLEEDFVIDTVSFDNKEIFELKNGSFKIKATADHRWYGKQRHSPKNKPRYYSNKFFTTEEINTEKSILTSALYYKSTSDINISLEEAKLLGYIVSDGVISWSKKLEVTSASKGGRKQVTLSILQSKNKFYKDVEELLEKSGFKYGKHKRESDNPVYHYTISSPDARKFLDRIFNNIRLDKHEIDWSKFVLSLSTDLRQAFYSGFFNGDGHRDDKKYERITQNYGSIYDALTLCCFLDGNYVSHQKKTDSCGVIVKQQKRYVTGQKMVKTNLGVQESYCISTENSTFVIRQGNTITITGNCLYGAAPPKIKKMLNINLNEAKELVDNFWNSNTPLRDLKKNLEKHWEQNDKKWILGIDRRKIRTRSKHSLLNALFQSGGVIFAKHVSVYLMEKMEEQGFCIDPFIGKPDICSMIEYHDEQDMYANPSLFEFRVFDTKEEADEFAEKWEGNQLSAISKGKNEKYFVALPSKVSIGIEESMNIVKENLKINVDMGFEYMLGNNWKECH